MAGFKYSKHQQESMDINLSPLIDMMFLLLIFFIVTTAFVEDVGVTIQKPQAESAEDLQKKSILIGVSEKGEVVYGDRDIGISGVRSLVSRLIKIENRSVIILADKYSQSGILVDVIDECKMAGAPQVSIATEKE